MFQPPPDFTSAIRNEARKRSAEIASLSDRIEQVGAKVQRSIATQEVKLGAMRVRQDMTDRRVARQGEELEDTSRQINKLCLIMSGEGKLKLSQGPSIH